MKQPFIWAHRGVSALMPENTMASFRAAVESGADGVELDVHLSADGVPVVIHDETLNRTTKGAGRVNEATWEELRTLDAGSWFADSFADQTVPSLEEALQVLSGKLRLNLELKEEQTGLAVLELLTKFHEADIVVSSFNHKLLSKLRLEDAQLPVAVLYDHGNWHKAVSLAIELKAVSFHPRVDLVTRPMIAKCHKAGFPVYPWTVDESCVVRALQRADVDGFFSNNPQKTRAAWFTRKL